jgi:hypothetical protein
MVASDTTRSERLQLPKKSIHAQQRFLQQQNSSHNHKKPHHRTAYNKRLPHGVLLGAGFWNILYNSVLTLELNSRSRAIAFADDLIILTRGETVTEAENFMNSELTKVQKWAQNDRLILNENKQKVMLLTRRKRKEKRR